MPVDLAALLRLLHEHLPEYDVDSIEAGIGGLDNEVFWVNGELLLRVSRSRSGGVAQTVLREATVLRKVAEHSPVPIPRPVLVDPEAGCLGYFALPGMPLIDVPAETRRRVGPAVAARLGTLLSALHTTPVDRLGGLVETDDTAPSVWLAEAAGHVAALLGPAEDGPTATWVAEALVRHRAAIEAFLSAPAPPEPTQLALSHNDLGIEHVLVDPTTYALTGVIDWTDTAVVDVACDFGLVLRDLGPAALDAALAEYHAGEPLGRLRERARFHARCSLFEDLAYGLETGRAAYVDKSLLALDWLFPASG